MNSLRILTIICVIGLVVGCGGRDAPQPATVSQRGVRVVGKSPAQWTLEYTAANRDAIVLWFGQRSNASYLLLPQGGTGRSTLKATAEGLVWHTGGSTVGPVTCRDFAFREGPTVIEADGSVIVGTCAEGSVGIRIAEEPNTPSQPIAGNPGSG
jgi:hypothetical protein